MARPKTIHNRTDLIINAADELFAHYGYERTSIEDIAKHLGISKGSIYLDFKTKEDIFLAVVERHADKFHAIINELVQNSKTSALDTLKMVIKESSAMAYDFVTRDFHTPEAILYASITIKSRCGHFFVRKRMLFLSLLQKAAANGEINQSKATEEMAVALLMATSSVFPPYVNNFSESNQPMDKTTLAQRADILIDLVFAGLAPLAPHKAKSQS